MSLFSIKLKTKNGNDVKKKETFTVWFRLKYAQGIKTTAEYTYRILHSNGVDDPQRVLELKAAKDVKSIEDLTLKVLLNMCHIIGQIANKHNVDPDFILFFSPDFGEKNGAWKFLQDAFRRPKAEKDKFGNFTNVIMKDNNWLESFTRDYDTTWTKQYCKKYKIKKDELDMLKAFGDMNSNTMIMSIDPNRDKTKYAKSIHICKMLQDRIDRNLQITTDDESTLIET
jgi:hypothetical protein